MSLNFWQTDILRLRAVEPDDWRIFAEWDLDSESARLCYAIPFPPSSEQQKKKAMDMALSRGEHDVYSWMMENPTGEVVGIIMTLSTERRNGTFGYGLAVRREHWGKGYASEAVRLVLRYYFNELGYQKCTVDVYDFNTASIRLHQKLGFTQEGCVRRMIFTQGTYHDSLIFGITAEEFQAGQ
jgi:RimJ/RimL family protein N-acetyltransferase